MALSRIHNGGRGRSAAIAGESTGRLPWLGIIPALKADDRATAPYSSTTYSRASTPEVTLARLEDAYGNEIDDTRGNSIDADFMTPREAIVWGD